MGGTETLPFEQHRENALPPEVGLLLSPLNIRAVHLQHMLSILPTLCLGTLSSLNNSMFTVPFVPLEPIHFASTILYIFLCLAFSLLFSFPLFHLQFLLQAPTFLMLSFFILFSLKLPLFFSFFLYNLCLTFMGMQRFLFCCCFFPIFCLVLHLFFSCFFPYILFVFSYFFPSFTDFFLNILFSNFVTVFVQHPLFSLVLPLFFSCFFPYTFFGFPFFCPSSFTQPNVYIGNLYI